MAQFGKDEISDRLARLNKEAEEREAVRKAEKENLPYLNPGAASVNLDVLGLISEEEAREAGAAALETKKKELLLVVFDNKNTKTKTLIGSLMSRGYDVKVFISSLSGLEKVWKRYGEIKIIPKDTLSEVVVTTSGIQKIEDISSKLASMTSDINERAVSTTEILEKILSSAVELKASDIHFETGKDKTLLRFRLDGLLYNVHNFHPKTYASVLNRIKLLSGLKINITNVPQDGRFTIKALESDIEIRTSIIPSEYGETIVIRVLDPDTISLTLSDLGLRLSDEETISKELKRPNGMILVTGPTGSGKTTSLYAFLKKVKNSELKVITIEDPIEYHLDGIEQTQVDDKTGYNFNSGLRSILRQDPDIILVGEVRDLETAEIAMHAALTGHLVFSTLHTNDAIGAIPRLVDLGVKASIIGPALNLIIAQRLVRRLCESCKKEAVIPEDIRIKLEKFLSGLPENISKNINIKQYSASGCEKCRHGFKGRLGIYEFLKFDNEFGSLIAKESTEEAIRKLAVEKGMVLMQADGILKTMLGFTTLEEVERITGPIEWAA
jgi:type II secretory ATPase GspE/PulE/Tfp pilus assembly ATPase PilB-like protein